MGMLRVVGPDGQGRTLPPDDADCAVLVASRTPVVTTGIRAWLADAGAAVRVVGVASTARELRIMWRALRPHVVVVVHDGRAPSLVTVMHHESPHARVLVLTSQSEVRHEVALIQAGASGVLDVCCTPEEFRDALALLRDGRAAVSTDALRSLSTPGGRDVLTNRQREILDLLNDGVKPREIAERLVISPNTVKTHMLRMRRRLQEVRAPEMAGRRDEAARRGYD